MPKENIKILLICFIRLIDFNHAKSFNELPDLKTVDSLLKVKQYFSKIDKELLRFSREDIETQLEIGNNNEDKYLNATELIEKYGYKSEIHYVETEDGYKPSMYRIPQKGESVLIVHGLLSNAVDWLTVGPQAALPYLLADRGYDVWLANVRGSTPDASGHVSYSAESHSAQYWDFSWDEIGRYDLPAFIDYILKLSGRSKLKYVGHSQGTTAFFVLCSERPDYNDKISLMIAFAPVAFMSHLVSPLSRLLAPTTGKFSEIIRNDIGFQKVTPEIPIVKIVTKILCGDTVLATLICTNIMFLLCGFDYAQLNVTNMPVVFAHTPGAAATKQFFHYAQEINSGKFRRYDYGANKNLAKYGVSEPPDYPVGNVTARIALFYRTHNTDWFSAYEDVLKLREKLKNIVDFYKVPFEQFAHTDYIWGKDVKSLVYDRVLKLFLKF